MTDSTFTIQQNTVNGLVSTLDGKASVDLSNSPYTTNRILDIPQDIKLELNNGTLTLKAGSKVYAPNGFEADGITPKFDVVIIENDITHSFSGGTKRIGLVNNLNTFMAMLQPDYIVSGPTDTGSGTTHVWYDTTNNLVKIYTNGAYTSGFSLPLGVFSVSGSSVTAIDQVFNGFGYVGSTVFVLSGVKVQQAAGFDGNMPASEIQTIPYVIVTQSAGNNGFYDVYLRYTDSTIHSRDAGHLSFDADRNLVIDDAYPSNARGIVICSYSTDSTGGIKTFNTASTDFIANSNASNFSQVGRSYLSGLGKHSSQYEDWTLLASGSSYKAPANGHILFSKEGTATNHVIQFTDDSGRLANLPCGFNGHIPTLYVDVRKGQTFMISYNVTGATNVFRFIYDEGETNV